MARVFAEMMMFGVFTVMIGALIFGGVTFTYLRDARRSRSTPARPRRVGERSQSDAAPDRARPAHRRAA